MSGKLDEKDIAILDILQENSKLTVKEISRRIGSPVTTTHSRIKRLEKEGYIKHYRAILNPSKLGYKAAAYILVSFARNSGLDQRDVAGEIAKLPQVQEVHIITGDWDILVKVRVRDVEDLGRFIIDRIRKIRGVEKTYTSVVLDTIKETTKVPLRNGWP